MEQKNENELADRISDEDLKSLRETKANLAYVRVLADKALAEKHAAELQVSNMTLRAYLKYQLRPDDILEPDGRITRMSLKQPPSQPQPQPETQPSGEEK